MKLSTESGVKTNMNIKAIATIIISKILIKLCRFFNLGGTTFPGKVAIKLYPEILKYVSSNYKIIMVTGTNGKTTTSRIIGQILKENNISYIENKSGANLVPGVTATFIEQYTLRGENDSKTALIEIDEAAFKVITDYIEPDILVVTNFFRDQLDRYGELYTTLKGVQIGLEKTSKTKLVLNGDDSLCVSLAKNTVKDAVYFGICDENINNDEQSNASDAAFCYYCKTKYEYRTRTFGHLGEFSCPNCGYKKPITHITCDRILQMSNTFSEIEFAINMTSSEEPLDFFTAKINLPGLYNIYNSLAAISCGTLLGVSHESLITALSKFECGFGRMETISIDNKKIKLILVKNPTGFNQVLSYLLTEEENLQIAFLINDNLADGTDISWLWDVNFEKLNRLEEKIENIYTSGTRGYDMALRLKYAGLDEKKLATEESYKKLLESGLSNTKEGSSFYILPTYTAMLDIRKILKNKFSLKEFWQ